MRERAASWRSLLYVPGNNRAFLEKAQSRGADALILDLEDSVPVGEKDAARDLVSEQLPVLVEGPSDICVRVNGDLLEVASDLRIVARPGVAAILLPKCEEAGKVRMVAEALDTLDATCGIGILPLVESAAGLLNAHAIASAHPRVVGLLLGSEDFAVDCQIVPSEQTLLGAKQQIVYAARAAGISPLGLLDTVAAYCGGDTEELALRSSRFGFSGATAIHPGTVAALNRGFSPSHQDVIWAEQVLAAMDNAIREGRGAVSLDGRMVDKPILDRARAMLARKREGAT